MIEWLQSLSLLERVFLYLAAPSTVVLLIQTVLSAIGLGHSAESDMDMDADVDTDMDMDTDMDIDTDVDFDTDMDVDMDVDVDVDVDIDADGMDAADSADYHHEIGDLHHLHAGESRHDTLRFFTIRGMVAFFSVFGWAGLYFLNTGWPPLLCLLLAWALGAGAMLLIAVALRAMRKLGASGTLNLTNALGKSASVYLTIPGDGTPGKVMLVLQERLVELEAVTDCGYDIPTGSVVVVKGLQDEDTLLVGPL